MENKVLSEAKGKVLSEAKEPILDRVLDLAVAIQQIPGPTFAEGKRAAFMHEQFNLEARRGRQTKGLSEVHIDDSGNVFACLPGRVSTKPLVVTAHLDTVFPTSTELQIRREAAGSQAERGSKIYGPGIGDNSLGVAGLLGLVWMLRDRGIDLPGDLWLVANTCEEGLGDLRGMKAVVDHFNAQPRAYIILEGMALGQIYHRGLGVQRYRITVRTAGGHSWVDFGRPSAIHELARLATKIAQMPLPARPRCSFNVGVISGGTSVNTIAAEAHMELDLRSESAQSLAGLVRQVEALVKDARLGSGMPVNKTRSEVDVSMELIGNRPAGKLPASHPLVRLARECLENQGLSANLAIGSTDANIPLHRNLPAICIGLTTGHGAHTTNEYINTAPLSRGLNQLVELVERAFQSLP